MKKKKILFFLYSLSGGGAERTVINIANNLDRHMFEVILVLGTEEKNDYKEIISKDIKTIDLNCEKLRLCVFKLRKAIIKEKPDLLFSTINANNIILLLSKVLTFKNIPTIVREANHRTQSGSVSIMNKLLTFVLYNAISNKIIALSKGVKNDLTTNFYINKNKISVIYNPIETKDIIESSLEKISDFKREGNEKVIIAAGRLVEQKDFFNLIKAFHIISQKVNARLIILGKGPQKDELVKLSKALDVEDSIEFLGFKKNPYKYMKESDVFILSSKWEGFGHVIVEAMATGIPVIATDCKSGPKEIIEDNKYGMLVPVGNYELLAEKTLDLLTDDKLRGNYSKAGISRALNFNAKKIVKQYEEVFMKEFLRD